MTLFLIIENHSELAEIIKDLLEKHNSNIEIIMADTGKKGIEKTIQHRPDVIVLDIMLPDMNGLNVAKQIKERVPASKIILLTMCAEHVLCQCDPAGITTAIKKSEIFKKLIPVIKELFKKQSERSIENAR